MTTDNMTWLMDQSSFYKPDYLFIIKKIRWEQEWKRGGGEMETWKILFKADPKYDVVVATKITMN